MVSAFEELYGAVIATLAGEPIEIPGRVRVIVLPSRREVNDMIGHVHGGMYWVSNLAEPTILVGADDIEDVPQVVVHELAHYVSYYLFPRQPYWFSEGLAQFVEGVAKVDKQGRRWAGGDPTLGWAAGRIRLTPAADLFSGRRSHNSGGDPYVTSWVLYHFLWNERHAQFSDFQRHLSNGETPENSWRGAFPEWDPTNGTLPEIDRHLDLHRRRVQGMIFEVKAGQVDGAFTTAVASSADLHMILLEHQLDATNRLLKKQAQRNAVEEALREEPHHPLATAMLASLDGAPALSALRVSSESHPADGRAWYLLAGATKDQTEREAALRRAAALWPDGALAHAALASLLTSTGRASEALPFANHAVDLAPWNPDVVAALALTALELGKCREALQLQARAVDVATAQSRGTAASDAQALRGQLEKYRMRCDQSQATAVLPAH